jgi:hypothetical protein
MNNDSPFGGGGRGRILMVIELIICRSLPVPNSKAILFLPFGGGRIKERLFEEIKANSNSKD